jgi:shikimate kinase
MEEGVSLPSVTSPANVSECDSEGYTRHQGCDHIFFIGFLGAGKSTLARNLGQLFNRRHLDTDSMVVHREHASVAELFDTIGEDGFRDLEIEALLSLRHEKSCLVSCGGGIIERGESVDLMRSMGTIVFLDIDLDGALAHITHPEIRPDLGDYEHARRLLMHRRPLYVAAADLSVDIRGMSFTDVAYTVGERLYEVGLL